MSVLGIYTLHTHQSFHIVMPIRWTLNLSKPYHKEDKKPLQTAYGM